MSPLEKIILYYFGIHYRAGCSEQEYAPCTTLCQGSRQEAAGQKRPRNRLPSSVFLAKLFSIPFYLLLVDVQDPLQRQFLKVEPVTLVEIRAHCLRVAVHHHGLPAQLAQGADAGDGAPVELDAAACRREQRQAEH